MGSIFGSVQPVAARPEQLLGLVQMDDTYSEGWTTYTGRTPPRLYRNWESLREAITDEIGRKHTYDIEFDKLDKLAVAPPISGIDTPMFTTIGQDRETHSRSMFPSDDAWVYLQAVWVPPPK